MTYSRKLCFILYIRLCLEINLSSLPPPHLLVGEVCLEVKLLQIKDVFHFEVSKFMYKYTTSQLPATFTNCFKFVTDVHPYNTKQIKTRQFALPKARSNSGAKMIKCSATEIWSRIPPEIKHNNVFGTFLAE